MGCEPPADLSPVPTPTAEVVLHPRDALLTDRPFLAALARPDGRTRSPHRHATVRPVIVSTQPGEWPLPPGPWPGVSRPSLSLNGTVRSRQPRQPRRLRGISSRRQRRSVPRAQRESGTVHQRRAVELPRPLGAREVRLPARRPLWTRRPSPHSSRPPPPTSSSSASEPDGLVGRGTNRPQSPTTASTTRPGTAGRGTGTAPPRLRPVQVNRPQARRRDGTKSARPTAS